MSTKITLLFSLALDELMQFSKYHSQEFHMPHTGPVIFHFVVFFVCICIFVNSALWFLLSSC